MWIHTLSGFPRILAIKAEVSFRKFVGMELLETLVEMCKWGISEKKEDDSFNYDYQSLSLM